MIRCWYRDDSNELHYIEEPAPYYCYRRNDADGTHKSLFGDSISKQEFDNRNDYNNYVKKRTGLFESDISPVYKYLSDNFYIDPSTFLNVGLFDIEVDYDLVDGDGYPTPDNPFGEISSVSLYDRRKDEFHMVVLHESVKIDCLDGENLTVHHCVTERQLLDTFFKLIDDIDILSAWNGDKYDIGYIYERCVKIYGDCEGLKKMCRNGHTVKNYVKTDAWGNQYVHYTLVGRSHVDYMELYKKFTFGERDSYALDSIAEYELKSKKLAYKGDLGDLYRSDPKTFFEYSLHDSRLLKQLDDKLRFMELCATVTSRATTKFTDVFGSIKNLEHTIINYCHFDRDDKLMMPDKGDNSKEEFEGGYVLETLAAAYGWCSSIDLTALYPSVIRAINISPETHMFQCKKNKKDFVKIVEQSTDDITMTFIETGEEIKMKGFEVFEMLKDMDYTISAYGSIFKQELGIIPEVLGLWFDERKALKRKSKEYYKAGDKAQGDYYDMMQNIRKLYLNSLYGAISNQYSRFYSIALASSVTITGQQIEKFQMWKADQIVEARQHLSVVK